MIDVKRVVFMLDGCVHCEPLSSAWDHLPRYVLASDYDRLERECERLRLDNLSKNGSIKAFGAQVAALQRAVKNRDKLKDRAEAERDALRAQVEVMQAALRGLRSDFWLSCDDLPEEFDARESVALADAALQAKP